MPLRRVELGRTVKLKVSNNNLMYLNLTQLNPIPAHICAN